MRAPARRSSSRTARSSSAPSFSRRGALRLPRAVRRAGGPPRPPPGAGHPAALHRRRATSCSRSATRPTRRAASASCSSWASIATTPFEVDGVADLAAAVRGGLHRQSRDRPGRAQRQRQARPGRGPARRPADDPDLRLRRRGGRPVGVVDDHRHGRGDRRRPGRARRAGRRPPARGRVRPAGVRRRAGRTRPDRRGRGDRG